MPKKSKTVIKKYSSNKLLLSDQDLNRNFQNFNELYSPFITF